MSFKIKPERLDEILEDTEKYMYHNVQIYVYFSTFEP